jgi:GH15 family glucan-1,4-alpha-glucosidase
VYGGLLAATNFATCFADHRSAQAYRAAAAQVRQGFLDHFWCDDEQRYLRRIEPLDTDRTGRLIDEATSGRDPRHSADAKVDGELEFYRDKVIDSSLFGIYKFQLAEASDPRVAATMQAVEQRLWIKTTVGGVARYDGDPYHSVTDNTRDVPGNPWFICTLWLADWHIARATSVEELQLALPVIDWVNKHALRSGVLAEQVHPQTNAALSVSPLTWSHATYVGCIVDYLEKLAELGGSDSDAGPHYRLRGRGSTRVADELVIDRFEARVEPPGGSDS